MCSLASFLITVYAPITSHGDAKAKTAKFSGDGKLWAVEVGNAFKSFSYLLIFSLSDRVKVVETSHFGYLLFAICFHTNY